MLYKKNTGLIGIFLISFSCASPMEQTGNPTANPSRIGTTILNSAIGAGFAIVTNLILRSLSKKSEEDVISQRKREADALYRQGKLILQDGGQQCGIILMEIGILETKLTNTREMILDIKKNLKHNNDPELQEDLLRLEMKCRELMRLKVQIQSQPEEITLIELAATMQQERSQIEQLKLHKAATASS